MKREELLDAIGNISSATVERNAVTADDEMAGQDPGGEKAHPENVKAFAINERKRNWRIAAGTLAAAAAVLIVVIAGGLFRDQKVLHREPLDSSMEAKDNAGQSFNSAATAAGQAAEAPVAVAEEAYDEMVCEAAEEESEEPAYTADADDAEPEFDEDEEEKEAMQGDTAPEDLSSGAAVAEAGPAEYVNIDDLLPEKGMEETEDVLRTARIKLGELTAQYECIPAASEDQLKDSLGLAVEESEGWYRILGHEDAEYLINVSDGKYTLWKLTAFLMEE